MDKKKYPIGPEHYTLYEEIGQGVSASVHRALCNPLNEVVAIKILDFERDNSDLVHFFYLTIYNEITLCVILFKKIIICYVVYWLVVNFLYLCAFDFSFCER